jgi:hypothetical protein
LDEAAKISKISKYAHIQCCSLTAPFSQMIFSM